MPPKGSGPRAAMLGYLAGELHDKVLSQEFRDLLREAKAAADANELSPGDRAIVREVWRDVSREEKLPVEFVKELTQVTSEAYHVWMDARKKKDFKLFAPHLTKIVALKRREAELVGFKQSPYDALLDTFEPYATTEEIAAVLGDLKNFLAPFLVKIKNSKAKVSRDVDRGRFRHREAESVLRAGRKTDRLRFRRRAAGRQRPSVQHQFSSAGLAHHHALRPLRIHAIDQRRDPRNGPRSLRARPARRAFWHAARRSRLARHPRIAIAPVGKSGGQEPRVLDLLLSAAARGISRAAAECFARRLFTARSMPCEPSFIRVEADEVTYNLHIILRFEIETALIEGDIAVEDLPAHLEFQDEGTPRCSMCRTIRWAYCRTFTGRAE